MDASSRQPSDGGGSCLRIVRMFAATCMLAFGLVAADALMTDVGAAPPPASCGAVNEPPCFPLFCDAGLVLSHGLCVRRDSLGFPTNCGDWNELPCEIWVHIPSCKATLIEHTGRCRMPDETFPSGCGGLNQRPCTIFEHIPSCKSNLVESHGLCVARDSDGFPTNCGGNDEPACVSIPACKSGLVIDLLAGGRCLPCGEDGRTPCLDQLCKTGFRFNFDPLSPGCIAMGPNVEPDCACSVTPETPPVGSKITGFADLHTHPFANLAFGGLQFWGKVFDPGGIRSALPWCDFATGISAVTAAGAPVIPIPFLGSTVHGPAGAGALFEAVGPNGLTHSVKGLGAFDGWPKWKTIQHQQMYYKWIERAFRGGLKLMVVHAVNNEVLCGSGSQMAGFGCDDMAAVDRQLKAARDLEAFIDQQSGGPGTGWFRIVTSGEHARQVINSGKMAAVLGIEVDTLFGCRPNGICTEAQLLGQLDRYYNLGVRHVFPVHFFNNGIGSPAVYEQALSVGNRVLNGAFYQTEDCSATYGFNLNAAETALAGLLRSLFGVPTNVFEGRGHCNAGGLTPIGEALIRGLIRKKMILDVDHMSAKMLGHVLDIVEAERYPVVSGHSEFLDISVGQRRAERVLTSAFANRIRDLGGMFAPILAQKTTDDTTGFGNTVENDCSGSSKSWAQAYLYAVDKMKFGPFPPAVAIGSDLNGGIESISPRFGSDGCYNRPAEQSAQAAAVSYPFVAHGRAASQTFSRLRTGNRTWDINTDGVANVGLLPDFIQDLKNVGLSDDDLAPLFRSAEHYVALWERIGARGTAKPTMTLDKTSLRFGAVTNGVAFMSQTAPQIVRLTQTGAGAVSWTATPNQPWLQISPASGSGSATLSTSVVSVGGLPTGGTIAGAIDLSFTGASNTSAQIGVSLNLLSNGSSASPFGFVDTPLDNTTGVTGSIPFTGWALDDVEVTRVSICRAAFGAEVAPIDPNCNGAAQIFVGFAVFIDGSRPDVAAVYPSSPLHTRAGWGFMVLTNMLPAQGNGTYLFFMYAQDREGHTTLLGTRTMSCANASATKPFGTIDTPDQGGVVSGSSFVNFGWALTPQPKLIPLNGSTISVLVDGAPLGTVDYNHERADIEALFPGFQNTLGPNGAIGFRVIDTTTLTNGLHTISWTVVDNQGAVEGIGSRFFTVSNEVGAPVTAAAEAAAASRVTATAEQIAAAPRDEAPVLGRRGWDLEGPWRWYGVGREGRAVIRGEEIDRFELWLGAHAGEHYTGHLRVGDEIAPLPVGSQLDATTGQFTWAPGVGFVDPYDLVFVRWEEARAVARHEVRVILAPKGSGRVGVQVEIDTPRSQQAVGQPFVLAGWAADLNAQDGTGIATLHAWAYPLAGGPPVFLGTPTLGGMRPDVAAVHGEPFRSSGFGFHVQGLTPGHYDLAVFAWSTDAADFVPAKTVRVTVR